jgi:heparan-alpha-glucosaminide N-acetyltransferase
MPTPHLPEGQQNDSEIEIKPYPLPSEADVPPPSKPAWSMTPLPTPELQADTKPTAAGRLVSLDAYRGLVMILMVSAGLGIGGVVRNFGLTPGWEHLATPAWKEASNQVDHVAWVGCVLWDLIQPSFMFMVGAALAFSLASRQAKGQSFWRMFGHALFRSAALVLLGVFLSSGGRSSTNWAFTIVLGQIGLGYLLLFLIAWLRPRWQVVAAAVVLVGYWGAFALYPAPPADFNPLSVGLPANWQKTGDIPVHLTQLQGFAAHWEKNTNLAAYFDQWFLNLFPRADGKPYWHEAGGYQTLNFVPSLGTMILGLLCGGLVRGSLSAWSKFGIMLGTGVAMIAAGWALDFYGVCPSVKRIWTPSWAIFSAGIAFGALAMFYLVIDIARFRKWSYFMVVVGANSIAAFCMSHLLKGWIREITKRHFGKDFYELPGQFYGYLRYQAFGSGFPADTYLVMGKMFSPMAEATVFLLFVWLVCWWAYRNKVFIKI